MLLRAGLVAAVFLVFGTLTLRHAGDSYFLADQVDQLQNFERLLQLHPNGLWGPVMSGTHPQARALGPLAAVLFGVPVHLGLPVDAVQVVTSLFLAMSALAAFLALRRLDEILAWVWLAPFVSSGIVWWNAGMLWGNTVLLPAGCLLLAAIAAHVRHPTRATLSALWIVMLLAAQVHLVALAALGPVLLITAMTWRRAWARRPPAVAGLLLAAGAAAAIGPYLLAEALSGGANTRVFFSHAEGVQVRDTTLGRAAAFHVLHEAADPARLLSDLGAGAGTAMAVAACLAALALAAWTSAARTRSGSVSGRPDASAIVWLIVAAIVAVWAQALFFVLVNRPILGRHYLAFLAPMHGIPAAAAVAWGLHRLPRRAASLLPAVLGAGCLALLAVRGPAWADRYHERTPWTYSAIVAAVDALCGQGAAARLYEGPAFAPITPGYDGVLHYLMTRGHVRCRHDPGSDLLIVAWFTGEYPLLHEERDGVFRRAAVVAPGLALYRRTPSVE